MSDIMFPASLKPIVSKGYSQTRGSNIFRTSVTGGLPRQGRDVYFEAVPFSVTLLTSSLGRQAFLSFLNNIHGGADSFIMPLDSGLGIQDHQVMITSTINDSTGDGINWTFTFTITAERTAIQEDTCLTANLPDLFGCYGDCLAGFLKTYGVYQTTFPRIWSDEGPAGYPPINMQAQDLDGRIVYSGPSVNYLNSAGLLASSAVNEWPLQFFSGASGRVPPEGQYSNYILQSQNIASSTWVKGNMTIVGGIQAPDGSSSSSKMTINTTTGTHQLVQLVSGVFNNADVITTSFFVKSNGYNVVQILWGAGANGISSLYANYDLSSGLTSGNAGNIKIIQLPNGWFRCSATVTVTGDATTTANVGLGVIQNLSQTRSPSWAGDGVSGVNVWGAQTERSPQSSSYISTASSSSSRPAASASVFMNGATSIDITYSDASVVNVVAVSDYAPIPQASAAWGSKFITRIDFNV